MTKRKNVVSRMFFALIVLTLVSCCFLGSTFARYTSTGSGSAQVGVAKWEITAENFSASAPIKFGNLSPSVGEYSYIETTSETKRTNTTGRTLVAEIRNAGEVAATVTVTIGDIKYLGDSGEVITESMSTDFESVNIQNNIGNVFEITWYYSTENNSGTAQSVLGDEIETVLPAATSAEQPTVLYIYAEVKWISQDQLGETQADSLDTWIGQNVSSVSWDLSYTAVQSTQVTK